MDKIYRAVFVVSCVSLSVSLCGRVSLVVPRDARALSGRYHAVLTALDRYCCCCLLVAELLSNLVVYLMIRIIIIISVFLERLSM